MTIPGRTRQERERGAILPIFALVLIALVIMAAIVVDLGGAREIRRQGQGEIDAAALGAAQLLPDTNAAAALAQSIANANGYTPNLNGCTGTNADPNALPFPGPAGFNCVSFDAGASEIRVYLLRTYTTAFAPVMGAKTLSIKAGATALLAPAGAGAVLPFGIAGVGAGQRVCLKASGSGTATGVCSGPTTGNFNYLDVAQYGNTALKTPQQCGSGSHDPRLIDNMAIGIDHLLRDYGPTSPPGPSTRGNAGLIDVQDAEVSGCTFNAGPDDLATKTGNIASITTGPLLTDAPGSTNESDLKGARLQRGSYVCASGSTNQSGTTYSYGCNKVEGAYVDDTPLWQFIGSGASHNLPTTGSTKVPPSCQYSLFDTKLTADKSKPQATRQSDMDTLLNTCFDDYAAGTGCAATCGPVFGFNSVSTDTPDLYDIQYSSRFGYAPIVCSSGQIVVGVAAPSPCSPAFPSGKSGNVFILNRQPLFIQELTDDNAKNLDFEPGVGYSGGSKDVSNLIAYAFPSGMLPGHLGDHGAPAETDVNVTVSLVR